MGLLKAHKKKLEQLIYCVVPEKNSYPPHGRSLEIPGGWGVLKANFLEAVYENKL